MTHSWRKHFPNSLGQLSAIQREKGDAAARVLRAHSLIYQALEELRPLVTENRADSRPIAKVWAALVDAEALMKEQKVR